MTTYRVCAFYKFTPLSPDEAMREVLFDDLSKLGVKGTVLLALEGVNGTIAVPDYHIDKAVARLKAIPGCMDLELKYAEASNKPFLRLKVRLKKEIVTMGVPGTDPTCLVGSYIAPEDWNTLIEDPDTVVIDTRNAYEVALGTFKGAVDPETPTFRDFPKWFDAYKSKLESEGRTPKIAMFCTGGIRCEKATSYVKAAGIDNVFHLQGGILKYLETVPEEDSLWRGECFVFDDRVSVGHGLTPGDYQLCHGCRQPVGPKDRAHPKYEEGVSCPVCADQHSPQKLAALRERQKQVRLAAARGETHIGDEVVMTPRR